MHIYKYLYVPEGLQKKKENLIKKLKNGKLLPGVYLITLASTDQNQLDIFPACIRRQKNYPESAEKSVILPGEIRFVRT